MSLIMLISTAVAACLRCEGVLVPCVCPTQLADAPLVVRGVFEMGFTRSPVGGDSDSLTEHDKDRYYNEHSLVFDTLRDVYVVFEVSEVVVNNTSHEVGETIQVRFGTVLEMDGEFRTFGQQGTEVVAFLYPRPLPVGWVTPIFSPTVGLPFGLVHKQAVDGDARCDAVAATANGRGYDGSNFLVSLSLTEEERLEVDALAVANDPVYKHKLGAVVTASDLTSIDFHSTDGSWTTSSPGSACNFVQWDEFLMQVRRDYGADRRGVEP